MVIRRDDAVDDPCLFENDQVPVRRTLGQLVVGGQDFGDRGGAMTSEKRVHHGPPIAGVALGRRREFGRRQLVGVAGQHWLQRAIRSDRFVDLGVVGHSA